MGIAIFAAARMVQAVPTWIDLLWLQRRRPAAATAHRRQVAAQPQPQAHRQAHSPTRRAAQPVPRTAPAHAPDDRATGLAHQWLSRLARLARGSRRPPADPAPQRACSIRPLRVLRVVEPQQPRSAAGRMVISGRMADVCAELDRLAAAEAASAPGSH